MGAATRFMFQPGGRRFGAFGFERSAGGGRSTPAARPRPTFLFERRVADLHSDLVRERISFSAPGAQMLGLFSDMPVAWVAHLGGFLAGLVLFPLFDRPSAPRR